MTTSAPISTLSQVLSELSLCLHPQQGPSCFPGSPQHSPYTSQLLSHVVQNTDGLSRGSDKGTGIVHPGQSFGELCPQSGGQGQRRDGEDFQPALSHTVILLCLIQRRCYLCPYSPSRMQSKHFRNAAASATVNPQWGSWSHRSQNLSKS